ncbi:hypothetical protein PR048_007678 [Dryococelus australis]|uniref:Uncharacterized protein n=1 Tax=Dryococelus australis TaxID=614101 RepID=A0ABQ9HV04_9NEOP|nr:hypothetical protein PR048_007678 [Dryococelus australis]
MKRARLEVPSESTIVSFFKKLKTYGDVKPVVVWLFGVLHSIMEISCSSWKNEVRCLKNWLAKRDKWLSGDIQNEIIEIPEHMLRRELAEDVKKSIDYGLIADGTTDISGQEQFTICLRCVDQVSLVVQTV